MSEWDCTKITYFINVVQNISKGNNTGFAAV